jgi:hypothetical protein
LAAVSAVIIGTATAVKLAGRRVDALEAERGQIGADVERTVGADFFKGEEQGKTLFPVVSRRVIDDSTERRIVDVASLDPRFAGWKARILYGDRWHSVKAIPPLWPQGLVYTLGSESSRHQTAQARKLILILIATAWSIAFVLLPVAGPWRRPLAEICTAASLLALVTWAMDGSRPRILSLPKLDWIAITSIGAFTVGFIAAIIPSRRVVKQLGQCMVCGYDLTGNVSGVCPECGRPTLAELRRRRDAELMPFVEAIQATVVEPTVEDFPADEEQLASFDGADRSILL